MAMIGSLISWAIFGLIIGLVARLLYPGRQPMTLVMTMMLGVVGSFVGGFISWMAGFDPEEGPLQPSGIFMSILGSLIVVAASLYGAARATRNPHDSKIEK